MGFVSRWQVTGTELAASLTCGLSRKMKVYRESLLCSETSARSSGLKSRVHPLLVQGDLVRRPVRPPGRHGWRISHHCFEHGARVAVIIFHKRHVSEVV